MNKDALIAFNRSRAAAVLVLSAVFLLLLFCNFQTDLIADDYRYCFSFFDDSRIRDVRAIFPSMAAHRHTMNGRVIAHFLVQLFLLFPKSVFNALNAVLFVSLLVLISNAAEDGIKGNALLLLSVFGCLWTLQPEFGQVFLWLDGSVNYLWCAVLCLVWLRPWTAYYLEGRSPALAGRLFYPLFSFIVGAYSENSSVALIAMALLFLLLERLSGRKVEPWLPLSLAFAFGGFLFVMLAPATAANKSAEMSFSVLFANFLETAGFYLRFWPLLLSFLLFYFLGVQCGVSEKLRSLSLVYLFGSLAGHFVLTFALYCAGRSTYIGLILLLAANAILFAPLWEKGRKKLLLLLCSLCFLFTAVQIAIGVADIRSVHGALRFNEELIAECVANGERSIQVPRPYAKTKYPALQGLGYLDTEDPTDWLNVYMAKYYGADSIIGY